jgi:hypothetical protein
VGKKSTDQSLTPCQSSLQAGRQRQWHDLCFKNLLW